VSGPIRKDISLADCADIVAYGYGHGSTCVHAARGKRQGAFGIQQLAWGAASPNSLKKTDNQQIYRRMPTHQCPGDRGWEFEARGRSLV